MNFIREYCAKHLLIVTTDVLRAIQSGVWLHHYSKLGKLPARVMSCVRFKVEDGYRVEAMNSLYLMKSSGSGMS